LVPKFKVFLNKININDQNDTLNKVKGPKRIFYYLWDQTNIRNQVKVPIEHLSLIFNKI